MLSYSHESELQGIMSLSSTKRCCWLGISEDCHGLASHWKTFISLVYLDTHFRLLGAVCRNMFNFYWHFNGVFKTWNFLNFTISIDLISRLIRFQRAYKGVQAIHISVLVFSEFLDLNQIKLSVNSLMIVNGFAVSQSCYKIEAEITIQKG